MSTRLKTILYITAIFLAGLVTGSITGACLTKQIMFRHPPRPHDVTEHIRSEIHSRLGLSPEQKQKIDPILDQTGAELKAIHMETMLKVAKAIHASQAKIAAELTPEQKLKLAEMEKQRREFMERGRPRGLPPRGENDQDRTPDRPPGPDPDRGRPGPPRSLQ